MPDEPITTASAPIRRSAPEPAAPHDSIVCELQASLRATEAYVRLLIDRLALARTSELVRLDGVPADVFDRLIGVSNLLHDGADRFLGRIDPAVARRARAVAELERESALGEAAR